MQNWEKMVLRISVEGIVPVIVERWEMVSRRCSAMRKLSSPLLSPFIRGRIDSMAWPRASAWRRLVIMMSF